MQITAWRDFSKKRNSTKRPATPGINIDVFLKEETSIENPSFILAEPMPEYTYIQAFGHYYFVSDVTNLDAYHAMISCTQDVLATFKNEILNTTARVIYSSSNYDLSINDNRIMPTSKFKVTAQKYTGGPAFSKDGCFIIGLVSGQNNNGNNGFATYFAFSPAGMANLSAQVFNSDDFIQHLVNQFTNPMDAIISCFWLPVDITTISGEVNTPVYIGSQDTGATGKRISARIYGSPADARIINRPTSGHTYLDKAPYTTGILYLPFVGTVPFDPDPNFGYDSLDISWYFDVYTGDIVYNIYRSGNVISTFQGNMSTNIPLSNTQINAAGVIGGGITMFGGIAATAAVVSAPELSIPALLGGVGAFAGGAGASISSCAVHTSVNGSNSSALGIYSGDKIALTLIQYEPSEDITAYRVQKGLPCFKTLRLGTLSGFCLCDNASIDINSRAGDRDLVNSYLNGGFYIE